MGLVLWRVHVDETGIFVNAHIEDGNAARSRGERSMIDVYRQNVFVTGNRPVGPELAFLTIMDWVFRPKLPK